jgi:hypothetical protein
MAIILKDRKNGSAIQDMGYIRISQVKAVDNKLIIKLDLSEDVRHFFLRDNFVLHYDKCIDDIDESILTIPPLFVVAPVAWAAGASVYVNRLDRSALNSLLRVRPIFRQWYNFSSSGTIVAKDLVDNKFNNKQKALLFSGGLDSTASYIQHKEEYPTLITLLRGETYPYEDAYYNKVKNTFRKFAKEEGIKIHFIRTDLWDTHSNVVNNELLTRQFGVLEWWMKVSHGLMILGFSAPLTVKNIGTVYIASTFARDYEARTGNGSHFLTRTNISWADVKVIYDGADFTRQEKIKYVLKENQGYCKNLRICSPVMNPGYYKNGSSDSHDKNCGICQKCIESIIGLVLEGIDPAQCNFDINNSVLDYVKRLFKTRSLKSLAGEAPEFYRDIQRHISETTYDAGLDHQYKTKKFFEWFKDYDISSYRKRKNAKLSMLFWAYSLMRYRGLCYTVSLIVRNLRNGPPALS